jgi:hypothetical protein
VGVASTVAAALLLALLGSVGGTVPTWTLAVPLLLIVPLVALINGRQRKQLVLVGELREARRQATESRKAEVQFRQQLDLAAMRDGPLDPTAQGFLRRIVALRESLPTDESFRSMANGAEITMIRGLIDDMREDVGRSRALLDAENIWAAVSDEHTLDNLRLTLNQLHALAEEFGLRQAAAR